MIKYTSNIEHTMINRTDKHQHCKSLQKRLKAQMINLSFIHHFSKRLSKSLVNLAELRRNTTSSKVLNYKSWRINYLQTRRVLGCSNWVFEEHRWRSRWVAVAMKGVAVKKPVVCSSRLKEFVKKPWITKGC